MATSEGLRDGQQCDRLLGPDGLVAERVELDVMASVVADRPASCSSEQHSVA